MNRRSLLVGLIVVALVLTGYVSGTRRVDGPPLDPDSTSATGTRALVQLVERLGSDVSVSDDIPAGGVVLLFADRLDEQQADRLDAFVQRGGRLVVTDPRSPFAAPITGFRTGELTPGACDLDVLVGVDRIDVDQPLVAPADSACFGDGDRFAVTTRRVGDGVIVTVGGPSLFTNERLGLADNAAFAVALLAPRSGTTVTLLRPAAPGGGDRGLLDLVDDPVRAALVQLPIAFVFVVLWRGRRLGAPVDEPDPVEVEASELTRASGRLHARTRDPARAADALREHAWFELRGALGMDDRTERADVVRVVAARTSRTPADVDALLFAPVTTDSRLVEVAADLARLRTEVLR